MEQDKRKNPGQMGGNYESQWGSRPAPGKVTQTSRVPTRPGGVVQRQPVGAQAASGAAGRSSADWADDPLMDAAHRGAAALVAGDQSMAVQQQDEPTHDASAATLELFTAKIGTYTVAELNDALKTVFGEISAQLGDSLSSEAKAVASTIFNRKSAIDRSRAAYEAALPELTQAEQAYQSATTKHDELAKKPSQYKKQLGNDGYAKALAKAKQDYASSQERLAKAQRKANEASSEKKANESYIAPGDRDAARVTLTMIVSFPGQYEGYEKGKSDHAAYKSMSAADKTRNAQRWQIAKNAVRGLASGAQSADAYVQFRSNQGGTRTLKKGEVRIGGNDFWK